MWIRSDRYTDPVKRNSQPSNSRFSFGSERDTGVGGEGGATARSHLNLGRVRSSPSER